MTDRSTSEQLRFTLNLSQPVPGGALLHFHVINTKGTKAVESKQVQFTVPNSR